MATKTARFDPVTHVPRYSRVLAQLLVSPSFLYFFIFGNIVMLGSATGFYYFEAGHNAGVTSFFDALWWSLTTITTVGYGDLYPATTAGRMVGMLLMASGVVFFVGATALLVTAFFARVQEDLVETEQMAIMTELKELRAQLKELQK